MESRKYDVFVSYSRKDAEIVDQICQLMRQNQIVYYRDTLKMPGGEKFFNELANSILDSVVFLYIGSKNSYSSIYTPKEINFAISKNTNIIIPYLIDATPLPDNLFLAFSDLNVRNKKEHSFKATLKIQNALIP
nr:toll/interleukin-1 receptor domain-containing protein [uncultured Prevotella sp.]